MVVLHVIKIKGQEVFACPSNSIDRAVISVTATIQYAFAFESDQLAKAFADDRLQYNPLLKDYEIKRIIELTT